MLTGGPEDAVLCLTVCTPTLDSAERILAEAWEWGALGVEERQVGDGVELDLYVGVEDEGALRARLEHFVTDGVAWGPRREVRPSNWSEAWKVGLRAIEISPRLAVAPSFVEYKATSGQQVVWIDPGQAFGTGGHASTRLVLDWIDRLAQDRASGSKPVEVLDVGTGSGVLALAALALGAGQAIGFDLDPIAVAEAKAVAAKNGLIDGFEVFVGGIEVVAGQRFDWVFANLLKTEMLPILDRIAETVRPAGWLVLAGLLEADERIVSDHLSTCGLELAGVQRERDDSGAVWISPAFQRPA